MYTGVLYSASLSSHRCRCQRCHKWTLPATAREVMDHKTLCQDGTYQCNTIILQHTTSANTSATFVKTGPTNSILSYCKVAQYYCQQKRQAQKYSTVILSKIIYTLFKTNPFLAAPTTTSATYITLHRISKEKKQRRLEKKVLQFTKLLHF